MREGWRQMWAPRGGSQSSITSGRDPWGLSGGRGPQEQGAGGKPQGWREKRQVITQQRDASAQALRKAPPGEEPAAPPPPLPHSLLPSFHRGGRGGRGSRVQGSSRDAPFPTQASSPLEGERSLEWGEGRDVKVYSFD